jgi:hypothetical protein
MKKVLLIAFVTVFCFSANAQGFRVGVNAGIPVGDFSDFSSLYANVDLDYDWEIDETWTAGITTGFSVFSGKDMFSDFKYIPIAGSVEANVSENIGVGGDVGYAISLEDGGGGDFLYRFNVVIQIDDNWDATGRFNNVSGNGATLSSISVGVGYSF